MQRRGYGKLEIKPGVFCRTALIQLVICLVLTAVSAVMVKSENSWSEIPRDIVRKVLTQEEIALPALKNLNPNDWKERAEEFIYQYLYQFPEEKPMGGELPKNISENTLPQDVTMKRIIPVGKLTAPLSGRITSPFGYRKHPISGKLDFHKGIDIAAPEGTVIHAAASGTVTEAGSSDSYGNYIVVRHSDDFQTVYGHCQTLLARKGDRVRRGDRIAKAGSTGISTGPHLHFEIKAGGFHGNPLWVLPL